MPPRLLPLSSSFSSYFFSSPFSFPPSLFLSSSMIVLSVSSLIHSCYFHCKMCRIQRYYCYCRYCRESESRSKAIICPHSSQYFDCVFSVEIWIKILFIHFTIIRRKFCLWCIVRSTSLNLSKKEELRLIFNDPPRFSVGARFFNFCAFR